MSRKRTFEEKYCRGKVFSRKSTVEEKYFRGKVLSRKSTFLARNVSRKSTCRGKRVDPMIHNTSYTINRYESRTVIESRILT